MKILDLLSISEYSVTFIRNIFRLVGYEVRGCEYNQRATVLPQRGYFELAAI